MKARSHFRILSAVLAVAVTINAGERLEVWQTSGPACGDEGPSPQVSSKRASDDVYNNYYVDFEHGSDDNDGRSPTSPFQHCPDDPGATSRAQGTILQPGSKVVFKGGVVYRGSLTIRNSGTASQPVVFDGNSQGDFGRGQAVLDGSVSVSGWRQCTIEACGGNLNWAKIWYADVPGLTQPLAASLYEGDRPLVVAQDPNLRDPFYVDSIGGYRNYDGKQASPTSIVDPLFLAQKSAEAWEGAYAAVWAVPNAVYFRKVTGFDPAAHAIRFEKLPQAHYTERPGRYSLLNSLSVLDRPGEFVVHGDSRRTRFYVWPHGDGEAGPPAVSVSRHPFAFNIQGRSHVAIEGFLIRNFLSREGHRGAGITNDEGTPEGLVIRDNIITACSKDLESGWKHAAINLGTARHSLVQGNRIYENRGCGGIYTFGRHVVIQDNLVRRNGYQGIWVMGARNCQVIGNEVLDNLGTHSNGISVYAGSSDILIFGNRVFNSNLAFTSEHSSNVTVACNVFYTPGFYAVADWGKTSNLRLIHNVLLRDDLGAEAVLSLGAGTTCSRANNIFVGKGTGIRRDDGHNLYVGNQQVETVFVDASGRNFQLRPGSPAIDAGTSSDLESDAVGTRIPQGKSPDIGAYEFVSPSDGS